MNNVMYASASLQSTFKTSNKGFFADRDSNMPFIYFWERKYLLNVD